MALRDLLAREVPSTAGGELALALLEPTPGEEELALEVAVREQEARLGRRLRALRVLAAASSALGFAGAIAAIATIHTDHSLASLDIVRFARTQLGEASRLLALGLGTSAFALSSLVALQARARVASRELHALADHLGRAAR